MKPFIRRLWRKKISRDILIQLEKKYSGINMQSNVNEILASLKAKKPSVIESLEIKRTTGDVAGGQRYIR